jgi:tetratricopeptide (TPR) repeat protein
VCHRPQRRLGLAVVLAILTTSSSGRSQAEPLTDPLEYAENAWQYGDYVEVVETLNPLVHPDPDARLDNEQLTYVYEILGASYYFLDESIKATDALLELLRLHPDHQLDAFLYPPSLLSRIEEIRADNQEELDAIRRAQSGDITPGVGEIVYVERRVQERSMLVSMIPFGVGQFVNDEAGWGLFYLLAEVGLFATSAVMYVSNENDRDDRGFFNEPLRAQSRQEIQLTTSAIGLVLVIANVVHGVVMHEDVVEVSYGVIDAPDETLEPSNQLLLFLGPSAAVDGWVIGFNGLW